MDAGVQTSFQAPSRSRPPELAALPYLCKTLGPNHAPRIAASPPRPTSTPAPVPLRPGTWTGRGKQTLLLLSPGFRPGARSLPPRPASEVVHVVGPEASRYSNTSRGCASSLERGGENGCWEGDSWVARARPQGNSAHAHSAALPGDSCRLRASSRPFLGPEGRRQLLLFRPVSATLEWPGRERAACAWRPLWIRESRRARAREGGGGG